MSFKISIIGAGSIGFTRKLVADTLTVPEFSNITISLMDIDQENLDMIYKLIERDIKANGLNQVKLLKTTDRLESLKDARYVLNVVRIGGLEAYATDVEIPLQYGVDQCVGDTLCAGGIMYGQRGIAFMLGLCDDIKAVSSPDVILLNYANPNAMMTWAANVYGGVQTLGLCHGVQHGHEQLAEALDIPKEELDYSCVGINHQTWYMELNHRGHAYTADELVKALEAHPRFSDEEKVRIDILKRFGYYSTESNGHLSEYLPWYRKRQEDIPGWISFSDWIHGETGGYLRICREHRNEFETEFPKWMKEDPKKFTEEERSNEHGSHIIEARETGRIYRGHFNVINNHAVTNLSPDAVVEVPAHVDKLGVHVPEFGPLPDGPAAICEQSISVQRLAVKAALKGDDFLLRQAMLLDPLT
ncbi:MAG: alpha-galactosidase, partial [Spirochaetales bacterium]|nr:alpha-galactosidase [Spirochaetales bacterium]